MKIKALGSGERALDSETRSAYHLYEKPGNSGENSNGIVLPGGNFPEKRYLIT